jgi:hypothetical protein
LLALKRSRRIHDASQTFSDDGSAPRAGIANSNWRRP